MSWLQRLLGTDRPTPSPQPASSQGKPRPKMPTVAFDSASASKSVRENVRKHIERLPEVGKKDRARIYDAAMLCILAGGDMKVLCDVLRSVEDMPTSRVVPLATWIERRAMAQITDERQRATGIKQAVWMHAGCCQKDWSDPTPEDASQERAHAEANGKTYSVGKGLLLNDKWTLPGNEEACKCVSRSVVPFV